jgi:hypothetical protein
MAKILSICRLTRYFKERTSLDAHLDSERERASKCR